MNFEKERVDPNPTDTIEINIVVTVNKRENYQEQLEAIFDTIKKVFPELNVNHMNSPIRIKIKS